MSCSDSSLETGWLSGWLTSLSGTTKGSMFDSAGLRPVASLLAGLFFGGVCLFLVLPADAAETASAEALPVPAETATPPADAGGTEGKLTVEQILAETLDEDDYGNPTRCIDMKRIRTTKILDKQHVVFRSTNRQIWLVKLIPPCRSLDYDDVLSLPTNSGRLCRLDSIYTIDRASGIPGVPCKIDTFREISREQYEFLREELKKHRNR